MVFTCLYHHFRGVLWVLTFPSCIGCQRPLLIAFTMKPWFLEQVVPCWQTCLCQNCSSESGLQLSIASARFEVKNQPWNFLPAAKMPFKPTHYLNPLLHHHNRRKFRSQTSDNMDRWKAEQGRGREKRKIRRKKSRRERVRRKKMQMREKVGKSRNTVFFQWFVAPEGRK